MLRSALMMIVLFGLYLLCAGSLDVQEYAAGAVVAVIVERFVRRMNSDKRAPLPKTAWLVPLLRLPWQVLQESWQLFVNLVYVMCGGRYREGSFLERPIALPADDRGRLRVAIAVFGICLTPNDYIVSIDRSKGTARLRILVGTELSPADEAFLELT